MKIEKITRKGYSSTLSKEQLWDVYKSMKTQRLLEDRLLKMYKGGQLSVQYILELVKKHQWLE